MLQIDYEVNARKVRAEGFREKVRAAFQSFGKMFITDLKSGRLRGNPIKRRSGNLANGWNDAFMESGNEMEERIFITGPGAAYARKQEEGGWIFPKNGKMLAWPVQNGPAATPSGAPRFSGPRNYAGNLFFFKAKTGGMFLAEQKGAKGRSSVSPLVLVYHLAPKVYLSPDESRRMGACSLFMAHGETLRKSILAAARGVI